MIHHTQASPMVLLTSPIPPSIITSFLPSPPSYRIHPACLLPAALPQGTGGESAENAGDKKVQQLLADMVRLQTRKAQVSDILTQRFEHLTDIAEQAKSEYDRIAENTMRGIDEASSKVMRNVEVDAQAFEEKLASARAEMEANEQEFDEFEKKVENERSEGLFFRSLYKPFKQYKDRSIEQQRAINNEAKTISDATKKSLGSKSRRVLYSILIILLSLTLLEGVTSDEISWPKITLYGGILLVLILQLFYEKLVSSNEDDLKMR